MKLNFLKNKTLSILGISILLVSVTLILCYIYKNYTNIIINFPFYNNLINIGRIYNAFDPPADDDGGGGGGGKQDVFDDDGGDGGTVF